MQKERNLEHWQSWARSFGTALRSTTKCQSIKRLEIAALARRIAEVSEVVGRENLNVLEVGCGNALNGLALSEAFPEIAWYGLDFSSEMVEQGRAVVASASNALASRMVVAEGDALSLSEDSVLRALSGDSNTDKKVSPPTRFDVIYTDRCLINLASATEQISACKNISRLLATKGRFLMLENSVQTHAQLNKLRQVLELPARQPAEYNVFIDEDVVIPAVQKFFDLKATDDFGSLHDVMLYAINPSIHSQNEVVYDDDAMMSVTTLLLGLGHESNQAFGRFGQNRLWTFALPQ